MALIIELVPLSHCFLFQNQNCKKHIGGATLHNITFLSGEAEGLHEELEENRRWKEAQGTQV
jgi:hypothetical protein